MSGRYALIVATDAYDDPKLRKLRTPALDAEALAGALRDDQIGGFAVELSINEAEHRLRRRIATFFAGARSRARASPRRAVLSPSSDDYESAGAARR